MSPVEFWKNFRLGEEVSISGAFIYNGLRRFHELRQLDFADEIFEVFYYLSVGLERLLKIAIVLLEHKDDEIQVALEQSLITHNHLDLLHRIKQRVTVNLSTPHNDFLGLLSTFYKTLRYDRFFLSSISDFQKERDALFGFLAKHLHVEFVDPDSTFGTYNEDRYRKFLRKIVQKISSVIYQIIMTRARELNLYTHELRNGSRAETVFLGEADIPAEDVLWKELLIFFMNTKTTSGYLQFLRGISPLNFDPERTNEYLDCFQSDAAKAFVRDELEVEYELLANKGNRLKLIEIIGAPGVRFDETDFDDNSSE